MKMKSKIILVFGLPGSGKTTMAAKISAELGATHINADEVRKKFDDWDFSDDGRLRQAHRMKKLANAEETNYVVLDFVCPKKELRSIINADVVVFMDTITKSRYEDTNHMFEAPQKNEKVTYRIKEKKADTESQNVISILKKNFFSESKTLFKRCFHLISI